MNRSERTIALLLRLDAYLQIFALVAVVMPFSWMNWMHELLGLGPLPTEPIVEYLARSLSTFYGLHGIITYTIASDVPRYKPLIYVWAWSFIALGVVTILIDVWVDLPLFWTLSEGPFAIVFGLVILKLVHKSES